MCQSPNCQHRGLGRRGFLSGVAAVSAAAALPAAASGSADAILLSCMDFRLIDDLSVMLNQMQYRNAYDHVILAGGSLGAVHPQFAKWHEVFWEHVGLAVKLHKIHEIIVINHRDCGAAKLAFGAEKIADPMDELEAHRAVFATFDHVAHQRFPQLFVKGFLMGLDGSMTRLHAEA
jgi:carbonic anhydrase